MGQRYQVLLAQMNNFRKTTINVLLFFSFSSFNLNNHILLNTSSHRGYAVSDANIQEFISDLITKYIPSDLPQWQVMVIPVVKKITNTVDPDISEVGNMQVRVERKFSDM